MFAKGTLAAAITAAVLMFGPETASAKTSVHIGVGLGGGGWCHYHPFSAGCRYGYGYDPPGYGYYPSYGYGYPAFGYGYPSYGYGYYSPHYYPIPGYRSVISCGTARQVVRNHGFNSVRARDCSGRTYSFLARKGGKSWLVSVNSRNSRIIAVHRL